MARAQLFNALDHGCWSGDVVEREVAVKRIQIEAALDFRMKEDCLQLGAEVDFVTALGDVERFDADAVARQHQTPRRLFPQRHGKHAAQARETLRIPLDESVENGFGIGTGVKAVTKLFELAAQFQVIVDFAVEDDGGVTIGRSHGLIAQCEVDYFEAGGGEGNLGSFEDALAVGSAMDKGCGCTANATGIGFERPMSESSNAAHLFSVCPISR